MHTISARGHSRLSVVGGVRVCFHCALFLCSGDSDVLKIKIRSGAQRGASSSVDSNDDGYKNLVRSDEREQMSHPDGGGALTVCLRVKAAMLVCSWLPFPLQRPSS